MVQAFLLFFLLQGLGELAAWAARLPVPGMVIGLALLFALLALRERRPAAGALLPASLDDAARALHGVLGLLFVPAGVGVVAHAELLASEGTAIAAAILASTLIGIAAAAAIAAPPSARLPAAQEDAP